MATSTVSSTRSFASTSRPTTLKNRYNHTIDIQAVVLDIAGNIGFSDADPSDPTFIHDLGTAKKDRDDDDKHNVLGWYSRHVYYLDDVDPYFIAGRVGNWLLRRRQQRQSSQQLRL